MAAGNGAKTKEKSTAIELEKVDIVVSSRVETADLSAKRFGQVKEGSFLAEYFHGKPGDATLKLSEKDQKALGKLPINTEKLAKAERLPLYSLVKVPDREEGISNFRDLVRHYAQDCSEDLVIQLDRDALKRANQIAFDRFPLTRNVEQAANPTVAHFIRAEANIASGAPLRETLQLLDKAIVESPKEAILYLAKGLAILSTKDVTESDLNTAEALLIKASQLAEDPSNEAYKVAVEHMGIIAVLTGKLDVAEKCFAELKKYEPNSWRANFHLAKTLIMVDEHEKALETLKDIKDPTEEMFATLISDPSFKEASNVLAEWFTSMRDEIFSSEEMQARRERIDLTYKHFKDQTEQPQDLMSLTEALEIKPGFFHVDEYLEGLDTLLDRLDTIREENNRAARAAEDISKKRVSLDGREKEAKKIIDAKLKHSIGELFHRNMSLIPTNANDVYFNSLAAHLYTTTDFQQKIGGYADMGQLQVAVGEYVESLDPQTVIQLLNATEDLPEGLRETSKAITSAFSELGTTQAQEIIVPKLRESIETLFARDPSYKPKSANDNFLNDLAQHLYESSSFPEALANSFDIEDLRTSVERYARSLNSQNVFEMLLDDNLPENLTETSNEVVSAYLRFRTDTHFNRVKKQLKPVLPGKAIEHRASRVQSEINKLSAKDMSVYDQRKGELLESAEGLQSLKLFEGPEINPEVTGKIAELSAELDEFATVINEGEIDSLKEALDNLTSLDAQTTPSEYKSAVGIVQEQLSTTLDLDIEKFQRALEIRVTEINGNSLNQYVNYGTDPKQLDSAKIQLKRLSSFIEFGDGELDELESSIDKLAYTLDTDAYDELHETHLESCSTDAVADLRSRKDGTLVERAKSKLGLSAGVDIDEYHYAIGTDEINAAATAAREATELSILGPAIQSFLRENYREVAELPGSYLEELAVKYRENKPQANTTGSAQTQRARLSAQLNALDDIDEASLLKSIIEVEPTGEEALGRANKILATTCARQIQSSIANTKEQLQHNDTSVKSVRVTDTINEASADIFELKVENLDLVKSSIAGLIADIESLEGEADQALQDKANEIKDKLDPYAPVVTSAGGVQMISLAIQRIVSSSTPHETRTHIASAKQMLEELSDRLEVGEVNEGIEAAAQLINNALSQFTQTGEANQIDIANSQLRRLSPTLGDEAVNSICEKLESIQYVVSGEAYDSFEAQLVAEFSEDQIAALRTDGGLAPVLTERFGSGFTREDIISREEADRLELEAITSTELNTRIPHIRMCLARFANVDTPEELGLSDEFVEAVARYHSERYRPPEYREELFEYTGQLHLVMDNQVLDALVHFEATGDTAEAITGEANQVLAACCANSIEAQFNEIRQQFSPNREMTQNPEFRQKAEAFRDQLGRLKHSEVDEQRKEEIQEARRTQYDASVQKVVDGLENLVQADAPRLGTDSQLTSEFQDRVNQLDQNMTALIGIIDESEIRPLIDDLRKLENLDEIATTAQCTTAITRLTARVIDLKAIELDTIIDNVDRELASMQTNIDEFIATADQARVDELLRATESLSTILLPGVIEEMHNEFNRYGVVLDIDDLNTTREVIIAEHDATSIAELRQQGKLVEELERRFGSEDRFALSEDEVQAAIVEPAEKLEQAIRKEAIRDRFATILGTSSFDLSDEFLDEFSKFYRERAGDAPMSEYLDPANFWPYLESINNTSVQNVFYTLVDFEPSDAFVEETNKIVHAHFQYEAAKALDEYEANHRDHFDTRKLKELKRKLLREDLSESSIATLREEGFLRNAQNERFPRSHDQFELTPAETRDVIDGPRDEARIKTRADEIKNDIRGRFEAVDGFTSPPMSEQFLTELARFSSREGLDVLPALTSYYLPANLRNEADNILAAYTELQAYREALSLNSRIENPLGNDMLRNIASELANGFNENAREQNIRTEREDALLEFIENIPQATNRQLEQRFDHYNRIIYMARNIDKQISDKYTGGNKSIEELAGLDPTKRVQTFLTEVAVYHENAIEARRTKRLKRENERIDQKVTLGFRWAAKLKARSSARTSNNLAMRNAKFNEDWLWRLYEHAEDHVNDLQEGNKGFRDSIEVLAANPLGFFTCANVAMEKNRINSEQRERFGREEDRASAVARPRLADRARFVPDVDEETRFVPREADDDEDEPSPYSNEHYDEDDEY